MVSELDTERGWWRQQIVRHQPPYSADEELRAAGMQTVAEVASTLRAAEGIVPEKEIAGLGAELSEVATGSRLLLIGGDCAERFIDNTPQAVRAKQRLLERMSQVMQDSAGLKVTRIGRMAGQYSKPRSHIFECSDGIKLLSYLGDGVNDCASTKSARLPDPGRMIQMYEQSRQTHQWLGASSAQERTYTGHEALLLEYEDALVRRGAHGLYGSSAGFLWVGDRTRQKNSAHLTFLARLRNPVGVKIGSGVSVGEVLEISHLLNPERAPGRLTLMFRMGRGNLSATASEIVRAVQAEGIPVAWAIDPMHGNTLRRKDGSKYRIYDDVVKEVQEFCQVMRDCGIRTAGLHVEVSGEEVGEVLSRAQLEEGKIPNPSLVDPRLDPAQAVDLAAIFGRSLSSDANSNDSAKPGESSKSVTTERWG